MEGKGRVGSSSSSSSSSFTAELFGSRDPLPPSSSSGIFSSIFPPPSKGVTRDGPSNKHGSQGQRRESLTLQEERVEPCHLSSSLYYGGQDVYSRSTTNQTYPAVKNERRRSGEDDANGQDVSRGNWWQGSLYY